MSPDKEKRHMGRREAVKWAIDWLHQRAKEMNDQNARAILNTAAFNMGVDAKRKFPEDRT